MDTLIPEDATRISSAGIVPALGQDPDDVDEVMYLYAQRNKYFLSLKEAAKDSSDHYEKITRKFKYLSKNYVKACLDNPYKKHYKLRQTYTMSKFTPHNRREWKTIGSVLHYVKAPNGYFYFLPIAEGTALVAIKSHVFERFIERGLRLEKWQAFDLPRDEIMFEVVDRLRVSLLDEPYRGVPLLDKETNSAYLPVEDGYLVGNFGMYKSISEDGQEAHPVAVTLFKTFLSHNEISVNRMDMLLELYRKRKEEVGNYGKN